jgi:hypothetical protein
LLKKSLESQDTDSSVIIQKLEKLLEKKFQNSGDLGAILYSMVQENFDSKLVTRPLVSKILGLNLRIIARIEALCQDPVIRNSSVHGYLARKIIGFSKAVEEKMGDNLKTVFERVYREINQ